MKRILRRHGTAGDHSSKMEQMDMQLSAVMETSSDTPKISLYCARTPRRRPVKCMGVTPNLAGFVQAISNLRPIKPLSLLAGLPGWIPTWYKKLGCNSPRNRYLAFT